MTEAADWQGAVGNIWAGEWRRTDRAFAGLSEHLDAAIRTATPAGAFRALDIGCGAGGTSLALAASRPDAAILGIDISPALIDAARERAVAISGLRFETQDVVAAAVVNGPFDLLYSRHGVMFFPDPVAAFTTLHTATHPGGALVFSCFADPADNGFAGPLARALGLPPPQAGAAPGPFAFADPLATGELLSGTGWHDLTHERVDFRYRVGGGAMPLSDAVAFLSRIGPAAAAIRGSDPARRDELRAGLFAFLTDYADDKAVDLPASAWLWSARA